MGVLPVVVWPDPRLSAVCETVDDPASVTGLAADMLETMYAAPGRGLAAPQVGVLKRLFVMDVAWKTVAPEPGLGDAEAAARRDFTLNAIAYDPFADAIIDPHGGREDLARGLLRHTSPAFTEDPLRVLRGFQLAARFDLSLAPETAAVCRAIAPAYAELPVERIWGEWEKWAAKSLRPSRGLAVLEETGWLAHFPEIAALRGTPQDPQWHPEGDVFDHTDWTDSQFKAG